MFYEYEEAVGVHRIKKYVSVVFYFLLDTMTFTIKYKIDSKPKKVRKVSDLLIGIGAVLFLVKNWVYTPLSALPLELQVFAVGEFIPKPIRD